MSWPQPYTDKIINDTLPAGEISADARQFIHEESVNYVDELLNSAIEASNGKRLMTSDFHIDHCPSLIHFPLSEGQRDKLCRSMTQNKEVQVSSDGKTAVIFLVYLYIMSIVKDLHKLMEETNRKRILERHISIYKEINPHLFETV